MKQRIFSGIQPSGNLHLGNYLGAIKNWVKLQEEYDSIFCVVDLHAITVPQDPEILRQKTIEVAKIYLAAGIDPKKSSIFIQSHVSEHTELAWILNTLAKIPELEKMTQFKDKSQKNGRESASVGLFDYPVLMAADILLYNTETVPVGEDQLQHIELARDLAARFNKKFGETFIIPQHFIKEEGMRIMGLDDPTKKMSKSAKSEYNYIALTDSEEIIRKKIKKAVTDSGSEIIYNDSKPALKNLINIYSLLADRTPAEIEKLYAGKGYGDFKNGLADALVSFLKPLQERMGAISDEEVLDILAKGAAKVRLIAAQKMFDVKQKLGFII
ncbi:MAG: tryptophan--tRNA ligase [Candidatus Moranbacteria bacterium]|nr:tryptophan--tRNA ligase [Candidatus Moranbacteria bacterium]